MSTGPIDDGGELPRDQQDLIRFLIQDSAFDVEFLLTCVQDYYRAEKDAMAAPDRGDTDGVALPRHRDGGPSCEPTTSATAATSTTARRTSAGTAGTDSIPTTTSTTTECGYLCPSCGGDLADPPASPDCVFKRSEEHTSELQSLA